jgi:hypothetical protein
MNGVQKTLKNVSSSSQVDSSQPETANVFSSFLRTPRRYTETSRFCCSSYVLVLHAILFSTCLMLQSAQYLPEVSVSFDFPFVARFF